MAISSNEQSKLSAEITWPLPGPSKMGPRVNPHTAVVLYVVPNHIETLPMARVSKHMDSPDEDSQTTGPL